MLAINIYYIGKGGSALKFAEEMLESGLVDKIRALPGCIKYEYFKPLEDENTLLLIDIWESCAALNAHHNSEVMKKIAKLREKYDLHMKVERYTPIADLDETADKKYIRE